MRGLRTAASFNLNIEPCTPYTPEENKYEETLFHTVSCHDIFLKKYTVMETLTMVLY
jgi:hypothetical protein